MFRAEMRWLEIGPTLKMEGSLERDWAERARAIVCRRILPEGLIIDLTDVSYVDSSGEELLKWLRNAGAEFLAGESIYAASLCERLDLPLRNNVAPCHTAAGELRI